MNMNVYGPILLAALGLGAILYHQANPEYSYKPYHRDTTWKEDYETKPTNVSDRHAPSTRVVETKGMAYQECLDSISLTAGTLDVVPNFVVATGVLTIVKFPTNDGSRQVVMITCSEPDGTRVVNLSR